MAINTGRGFLRAFILVVAGAAVSGCGEGSGQGTVSGTVSYDGQPLKSGLIRFVPVDGRSATADANIVDGSFTAQVPAGDKKVEITAPKVVGTKKMYQTPESPTVDVVQELLPERYNVRSELTITVAGGEQQQEFALKSGK